MAEKKDDKKKKKPIPRKRVDKIHSVDELKKQFNQEFKSVKKILAAIRMKQEKSNEKYQRMIETCIEKLQATVHLHKEMEATHRNVLLAIKQNLYLQAFYPEQQGYSAGNCTGPHPIKQERIDKYYASSSTRQTVSPKKT